jgi:homoserine kinase type II
VAPEFLGVADGRLVLEYVDGVPLAEIGDIVIWERAAGAAAAMHGRLAGAVTGLPRLDAGHYARVLERARCVHGQSIDGLLSAYWRAVERVLGLPDTVVHGELYPSNILVRTDGTICLLDWETASIGAALLDLAALTSGTLEEPERTRIVTAYARGAGRAPEDLSVDLERCRMLVAFQWLGRSPRWSPPTSQRTDWLREAIRAAEASK